MLKNTLLQESCHDEWAVHLLSLHACKISIFAKFPGNEGPSSLWV